MNDVLTVDDSGTTGLPRVTMTYSYDNAGNVTSLADSLGGLTSYAYDALNQLTEITQSGSGVTAKRVDYTYNAAGNMTSLTRSSDLAGTTTVLLTAYGYDNANRLTSITHGNSLKISSFRLVILALCHPRPIRWVEVG